MTDYATLVQDLQDWPEDDSAEFIAEIPSIITRSEELLYRAVPNLLEYSQTASGTLTASSKTLTHGVAGLRSIREFTITVAGEDVPLNRRTDSFLTAYTPNSATTGQPKFYAQVDSTAIAFAPTPDQNYAYTLKHRAPVTGLSVSNTTTWLSQYQYDLLLDVCLFHAAKFLKIPEQMALFKQEMDTKIALFQQEVERSYRNENTSGL